MLVGTPDSLLRFDIPYGSQVPQMLQPLCSIDLRFYMQSLGYHFVAFMGLVLFAQSQPPAPSRTVLAQEQQQHASSKNQIEDRKDAPANPGAATALQIQPDANSAERGNKASDHEQASPADRWGTVPDWIVAAAAIVALLIYGTQACYMRSANKATNSIIENMRLEQRAWLSINESEIVRVPPGEPSAGFLLQVFNSGHTPGIIQRCRARACWERPSKDSVPRRAAELRSELESEERGQMAIAPNRIASLPLMIWDLNERELERPRELKEMFVIVRIEYIDTFGSACVTQQCCLVEAQLAADGSHLNHAIEYKYGNIMT